ncbi:hypothetical protein RQP46_001333 [Phenoliferia psychrophenolica]
MVNITFCLVISTNLVTVSSPNSNIARAFSRRCGRMAAANFPYGSVRFYHKVLGGIVTLQAVIHALSYTACYIVNLGVDALHEQYTELYFKLGIAALVMMSIMSLTAIRAFRHRFYEIFLILHVVGAAVVLAGAWYHRPIMEPWVYAASAIWSFERASRLARHFGSIFHRRIVLRSPLLSAEAKVVHGAIVLSVPFAGAWGASQHCYISFWTASLLTRPWLYGQSHPFSIANVQPLSPSKGQTIELVLRIKKGITRTLANHIEARTKASGKATCSLTVMAEGPYGQSANTFDSESVLLLAGGSGITFVASALEDVVRKVEVGESLTTHLRLVWAVHYLSGLIS